MHDLDRLIDPQSVAIVGLSDDQSKHGGRVLASLRKLGYPGEIWGVNPRLPQVEGVEMYGSLLDLPTAPDAVACAVPAGPVADVVTDASTAGAGGVIVFAGGFNEAGADGETNHARLMEAIHHSSVPVLGPNSGGVIRPGKQLAMSFLTCLDRPLDEIRTGPVGLVTQSGGTGSYVHNLAAAKGGGLGISISTGNELSISIADGINALVEMPEIKTIALVLETVRVGDACIASIVRANNAGKPVVACRIGTSDRGQNMATTHTGAMAGSARVIDGVLASLGVVTTETPAEMLEVADVLARTSISSGDRVGMITHSGGIAIMLADLAERSNVNLPPFSLELQQELEPLLEQGSAGNPLDMGGIIGGPARFGRVVDGACESGEFDKVLAVSTAHPRAHTVPRVEAMLESENTDRVIHLWMAGDVGAEGLSMLRAADRAVTEEPRAAIKALATLGRRPHPEDLKVLDDPESRKIDNTQDAEPLSELEAKQAFSEWGIPVPEGELVRSADEAAELAQRLDGDLVFKISSPGLTHKTEVGGVLLGVQGADSARRAFLELTTRVRTARPDIKIDGVIVERQHRGLEVIVGGHNDPVFGKVILVGMGGTAAEHMGPPAIAPAPLTSTSAMRLLERATGLAGALNRHDSTSVNRLVDLLVLCSRRMVEVDYFEINPLAWTESGWMALDAVAARSQSRSQ